MKFSFDELPENTDDVIHHHSKSFSLAASILPANIRQDVITLYAWCRWCDDAVDKASSPKEAQQRVQILKEDVERVYAGEAVIHPASRWLVKIVDKYQIPKHLPLDLLHGMESDLDDPVLDNVDELMEYCYQAAGTVGLMMARIMGVTAPKALESAKALGMAMQLTNIARDVGEDWRSGRRYIPKTWLSLIPKKDMEPSNKQTRQSVEKLLSLADKLYKSGFSGLSALPNGARIAIRLAGKVYREIGAEIRQQGFPVMTRRVFVPKARKKILAAKCCAEEIGFRCKRMARSLWRRSIFGFQAGLANNTQTFLTGSMMNKETQYLGYLGISLTLVMATTLFFLMGFNPKQESYDTLPSIYSASCALMAAVTGLLAKRTNHALQEEVSRNN